MSGTLPVVYQEPVPMSDTTMPPPASRLGDMETVEPGLTFVQVLAMANGGEDAKELNEMVRELVATLENLHLNEGIRKSKASLSIKMTFDREDGSYRLKIEPSLKLPKAPKAASIFWANAQNQLTPENPRQMSMFDRRRGARV